MCDNIKQYDDQISKLEKVLSFRLEDFNKGKFGEPGFVSNYLQMEDTKRNIRKLKHRKEMTIRFGDLYEPHNNGQS